MRNVSDSGRSPASQRQFLPEPLESRQLFNVFIVNTPADGGAGSLRDAITLANESPGKDTIEFDLSRRGSGTDVRMRWMSDSAPDERGIAITRQRLNAKLGGDLRGWFADDHAWRS